MYDSPINIYSSEISTKIDKQIERTILTITNHAGIAVDRDKIIAALTNDKKRYEDAFQRGYSTRDKSIVRCKDCKHGEPCNEDIYCKKDIGTIETSMHKPDWFCADGEEKHDD